MTGASVNKYCTSLTMRGSNETIIEKKGQNLKVDEAETFTNFMRY